jgi:ferredoxin/flavodoxin---NADP+ reductase
MLRLAREKYLFRFQERRMTTGLMIEQDRVVGLRVMETRVEGRKAEPVAGTEQELRAPLVISSIGSVPEVIPGITTKGDYYTFQGERLPHCAGSTHVFGVGNVLTGQGNIRVSLEHSKAVTAQIMANYLGCYAATETDSARQTAVLEERVEALPGLTEAEVAGIEERIRARQQRVGYDCDYDTWIKRVTPPDLE